jgi:hypothetical protein
LCASPLRRGGRDGGCQDAQATPAAAAPAGGPEGRAGVAVGRGPSGYELMGDHLATRRVSSGTGGISLGCRDMVRLLHWGHRKAFGVETLYGNRWLRCVGINSREFATSSLCARGTPPGMKIRPGYFQSSIGVGLVSARPPIPTDPPVFSMRLGGACTNISPALLDLANAIEAHHAQASFRP